MALATRHALPYAGHRPTAVLQNVTAWMAGPSLAMTFPLLYDQRPV